MSRPSTLILTIIRLAQGWIFFWAFIDKLFGLGWATKPAQAWISGGSPTAGFLARAPNTLIQTLGGQVWVDWLFMIGLLGLGLALIFGIGLRIASIAGPILMLLMWFSLLPLANNPFMDQHIIYALLFILWPHIISTPQWWQSITTHKQLSWLR